MSKVVAIALVVLAFLLPTNVAWSAKPTTQAQAAAQKRKLEAIQAQIKKLSEDQKLLEQQRTEANKSVREMDAKVAEASKQARKSQQQLTAQQSQLKILESEKQVLEAKLEKQKKTLAALIRSAYAVGKSTALELILAQDKKIGRASCRERVCSTV